MYRQLSTPFGYREDFETTLCSGTSGVAGVIGLSGSSGGPCLDTDMELSLNANLVNSSSGTTHPSAVVTNLCVPHHHHHGDANEALPILTSIIRCVRSALICLSIS